METSEIGLSGLGRIDQYADAIRAKAMELTDTWGGAMFIVDPEDSARLFKALGFQDDVAAAVYERVYGLHYVDHVHAGGDASSEFTWHGPDVTTLVLRGFDDPGTAFSSINDATARDFLLANRAKFERVLAAIPAYASKLMFSTKIGCGVLRAFGAQLSEESLFDLALEFGRHRTTDLEGRRGVPTAFVRAFTLTMSSTLNPSNALH
jgi:hypothetical protein